MPPSTDPLDGLNKPIPEEFMSGYRLDFNTVMQVSTGQKLDWNRGFVLQVARFDPSKGKLLTVLSSAHNNTLNRYP